MLSIAGDSACKVDPVNRLKLNSINCVRGGRRYRLQAQGDFCAIAINLLLWPAPHDAEGGEHTVVRHGYTLLHWTTSGMTYWAISNLNMHELQIFAHLVQQHAALTPSP